MPKFNTFPTATPDPLDRIGGIDRSNQTNDPEGEFVQFEVHEFALTRTQEQLVTSASHQLLLTNINNFVAMDVSSANEVVLPSNATDPTIPIGATAFITQEGTGVTSIRAEAGATLRSVAGGSCSILNQFGSALVRKRSANEWTVHGDVGAVT